MRKVITSKQNEITLDETNEIIRAWLEDPANQCDTILRQINEERMYDPIFANRNDMTVIDFGANAGFFTLYAQDSCEKLIAVEPFPTTFKTLQEMTKNYSSVLTVQSALGNQVGSVDFYMNENSTTNSLINRGGTSIVVPSTTLANMLENYSLEWVDFIKCDIEGSEVTAITDATLAPVADRVGCWFIEIHQTNVNETGWPGNLEQNRQNISAIFRNHGYETEMVIHDQLFAYK